MSRCGCSRGGSGGVLVAGPGIDISGDGTPQRPRTIEIVADPHVCTLAKDCMSRSLCRGLSYDGSCIGIDLSEDPGNQLGFATEDGGLYGTCDAVLSCGQTVDNLPDFIRGGTYGNGANNGPAVAASYERAITMGLPMSMVIPFRMQDGVWIFSRILPSSTYAIPSSNMTWQQLNSHSARSIVITDDPAWDRGFQQRGPSTLDEIVKISRGRHVLSVVAPREASVPAEGTVQDLVNVLSRYCAQRGAIVTMLAGTAADRARLSVARAAGYDTGVFITTTTGITNNPPAALVAEGVKWVFLHNLLTTITDQVITDYVAAGLEVVMMRAMLRTDVDRATRLNMRGVLADDPGYVYGKTCALTSDPWVWPNWDSNQIGPSQLVREAWSGELGRTTMADGWGGGAQVATPGWRMPDEANTRLTGAVLLGWAAPLASPTAYTITWEQWWGQLDGGRRNANTFGLVIACTDDALPVSNDQRSGPTVGTGRTSGYVLGHAVGDPAAPGSTAMTITKLTKGAAAGTPAAATGTANLPVDTWVKMRAIVTPTSVTFQRLTSTNTVQYQVVLNDGANRGHFMWAWKDQGETPSGQRFATAYRFLTIT